MLAPDASHSHTVACAPGALGEGLRLPNDVLGLIFSLLSSRPLLLVVSVVCKQWRKCALRAITSLPLGCALRGGAVGLLPSLTDLHIFADSLEGPLPASLRHLEVMCRFPNGDSPCGCNKLRSIVMGRQRLQSLHLRVCDEACERLVWDNLTSLTSLRSSCSPWENGTRYALPALVDLQLGDCEDYRPQEEQTILQYASQLTSLHIPRYLSSPH